MCDGQVTSHFAACLSLRKVLCQVNAHPQLSCSTVVHLPWQPLKPGLLRLVVATARSSPSDHFKQKDVINSSTCCISTTLTVCKGTVCQDRHRSIGDSLLEDQKRFNWGLLAIISMRFWPKQHVSDVQNLLEFPDRSPVTRSHNCTGVACPR